MVIKSLYKNTYYEIDKDKVYLGFSVSEDLILDNDFPWPENVRKLKIAGKLHESLKTIIWPETIEYLSVGYISNFEIFNHINWPKSIKTIDFWSAVMFWVED